MYDRLLELADKSVSIDDNFAMVSGSINLFEQECPIHTDRNYIGFCLSGSGNVEINLKTITISKNDLFFIARHSIVFNKESSDDFRYVFFSISPEYMKDLLNDLRKYPPVFLANQNKPTLSLKDEEMEHLMTIFNLMWKHMEEEQNEHQRDIVKHLLCSILISIHRLADRNKNILESISRKEEMVRKFFNLVFENFKEAKDVSFYADKLCVSPKYLSSLVKKVVGQPAKECIDYCVILESKLMLRSSCTIQEISQELNFPNQSFFGKYFKKHTGMSPINYRKSYLK